MKFWGLILICASSGLALLLPALGVVRFPMGVSSAVSTASNPPDSHPIPTPAGEIATTPSGIPGPSWPQSMRTASDPASLPPSLKGGVLGSQGATAEPAIAVANPTPSSDPRLGRIPFTQVPSQKVGLGVWVCLIPVMLLGLGMWTFSPSPRKAK